MAKASQLSTFERHVEKLVVALCLVLLLYGISHWLSSSPREVKIDSGPRDKAVVDPGQLDEALLDVAQGIEARVQRQAADEVLVPNYARLLSAYQAGPKSEAIINLAYGRAALAPNVPPEPERPELSAADLAADIPAPQKPMVWSGRELPRRDPPADVVVAHAAAVLDWDELVERWNSRLQVARTLPLVTVVVGVDVEVREVGLDGKTTDPRPASLTFKPRVDSLGKEVLPPTIQPYEVGSDPNDVRSDVTRLGEAQWQEYILQPAFWDIWWPAHQWGSWRIHLPHTIVSDAAAEEEAAGSGSPTVPMPLRTVHRDIDVPPRGPMETLRTLPTPRAPVTLKQPAKPARTGTAVRRPPESAEQVPAPEVTPVGSLEQQKTAGKILAWFHDTSLVPLRTYQYRVRVKLVNPLLTYDKVAKTPADAEQVSLVSPWSQWSDPFSVQQAAEFFVTGFNTYNRTVRVRAFARSLGQIVRKDFNVSQGWSIGARAVVAVTNPADGQPIEVPVDFSTGAIAVAIDFEKLTRTPSITRKTVELLYLDENGTLRKRTLAGDEASARYRQLMKESRWAKATLPRQ